MSSQTKTTISGAPWVIAITGASGARYAVRLLETVIPQVPVHLIVSSHGWRLLDHEAGIGGLSALEGHLRVHWENVRVFEDGDRGATPASGSALIAGMVVCPCSMGTVSAIAHGSSRSLVERAGDVMLKERRPLILVPRETPLSLIHLRNLTAVAEAGGTIMPAAPGFYHDPKEIDDLIDFVVQRVVDQMGLSSNLSPRWSEGE
jgi:4-hydroxy-3-polyprenylbenzoate decarboxylase